MPKRRCGAAGDSEGTEAAAGVTKEDEAATPSVTERLDWLMLGGRHSWVGTSSPSKHNDLTSQRRNSPVDVTAMFDIVVEVRSLSVVDAAAKWGATGGR